MVFSEQEKFDILLVYTRNNQNAKAARREYSRLYPDRRLPHRETFRNIYTKMDSSYTLKRKIRTILPNENEEMNVLLYLEGREKLKVSKL